MERTLYFESESMEEMVQRFQRRGLETINLGYICFRFAPALREMNLVSVLTKIRNMLRNKNEIYVEDSCLTSWRFHFYAYFIQYLINRNIQFEMFYISKDRSWLEKLNLAILCRQLGSYRREYEKKVLKAV